MASFPLRLRLQIYTFERYSEYVSTALNGLRGTVSLGGDNFDWFASFDKHPQTLVFFGRPRGPCQCCYFAFILNRELPRGIPRL